MDQNSKIGLSEDLVTLREATKLLPRINGNHPNHSTLWRWCRHGLAGVHLEYVKVGRRILTSRQSLDRFIRRLATVDDAEYGQARPPHTPTNFRFGGGEGRTLTPQQEEERNA